MAGQLLPFQAISTYGGVGTVPFLLFILAFSSSPRALSSCPHFADAF